MTWVRPADPLILDLDADGIEATAIDPAALILFDHDGDGVKTATGWIKSDDGIVVLDLNGNGLIDSGRELFGDNTLLADGTKAANGYEALAQYDANADGRIDSADAAYTRLRIWQDANQDGVSQPGELKTLAELGIASIDVTGQPSDITLGNGNSQPFSGSFTRTNGTTGASGTPELSGSLLLASNNFYREFTDDPALTPEALVLPQMRASGWVRDLREAMSLGTAAALALQDEMSLFAAATTRDEQMALLDTLIAKWAATSDRTLTSTYKYNLRQADGVLTTFDLTDDASPAAIVLTLHPEGMEETVYDPLIETTERVPTPEGAEVLRRLNVLEAFNGDKFIQFAVPDPATNGGDTLAGGSTGSGEAGTMQAHASLSGAQIRLLDDSYAFLRDPVYAALVLQTRLKPYLDSVALTIDETGLRFDVSAVDARLDTLKSSDPRNALIDLVELNRFSQTVLLATGYDGMSRLRGWIDALPADSLLRAELASLGVYLAPADGGSSFADLYLGDAAADRFYAGGGNDTLAGGAGDDFLQAGPGDDLLDGGAGNDTLAGDYVNTFNGWYGGAGSDTYVFGAGDGQDTIHDLDTTAGVTDRILFKPGVLPADVRAVRDGDHLVLQNSVTGDRIVVNNYFAGDGAGGWAIEEIVFADGTVWTLAEVKAQVLTGTTAADTLIGFETGDELLGQAGADTLYGRGGADQLLGGEGADILWGEAGNDLLSGGEGNDSLHGGAGDDSFDGGGGNDLLAGDFANVFQGWYAGAGNDSYLFGRGDGQDTVYDYDTAAGNLDRIVFKSGVAPGEVQVLRSGSHLVLKISGTTDQITVSNFFAADAAGGWTVEEIRFADALSTVWDVATLKAMSLAGGPGNDTLTGFETDDLLRGDVGNDTLNGRGGADTLLGGEGSDILWGDAGNDLLVGDAGNDSLHGGAGDDVFDGGAGSDVLAGDFVNLVNGWYAGGGNDTYRLGRGDGQDRVYDLDGTAGNLDTIHFKAGVSPDSVRLARVSNDLYLMIVDTTDQIQVVNYFDAAWQIEEIRFVDQPSVVWTQAEVAQALANGGFVPPKVNPPVNEPTQADPGLTLAGTAGNDKLVGGAGDDTLAGGAGKDRLSGGAGDDTLEGGAGKDVLIGGSGNDIYVMGRASSADRIQENDATAGNHDILRFDDARMDQLWFQQRGHDLQVSVIGTLDKVTIDKWFEGSEHRIEEFRAGDGRTLLVHQVDLLVQTMAQFAPPPLGQTTLPPDYQSQLALAFAAN